MKEKCLTKKKERKEPFLSVRIEKHYRRVLSLKWILGRLQEVRTLKSTSLVRPTRIRAACGAPARQPLRGTYLELENRCLWLN